RRDNLDIYWGANDGLINPTAETIHTEIPHIENRVWASDFNNDGKDDILLYYEKLEEPRKLKVVMSQ
nr:VCBS repeat-containing protein [Candidatus Neomarinimicrobiota bacterium]